MSLVLYQQAYAAPGPYPGPIALPGIPNGPALGCNNPGTPNATWVSGFNVLSTVHFRVDGQPAGTAVADSDGAVVMLLTFTQGQVQINGNPPVADRPGANTLVVTGVKTSKGRTRPVGISLAFSTPAAGTSTCAPPTTSSTSSSSSSSSSSTTSSLLPKPVTTKHGFYPTTLAKVTETPLVISPNKVIMETSLVAGVLGAALCAGALGTMWAGNGRGGLTEEGSTQGGGTEAPGDGGAPPAPPGPPTPPAPAPAAPAAPAPEAPTPEPPAPPAPGGGGGAAPGTPNAFSRPNGGGK